MSHCQGCGRTDMAGITHVCPPPESFNTRPPCEHRNWLPLIVHNGATYRQCLGCGRQEIVLGRKP